MSTYSSKEISVGHILSLFAMILGPEKKFYILAVVYGLGISLLTLGTPISVQMLINTIANTGLTAPIVMLSLTLFGLLLCAGILNSLRIYLMELFARRFYARMVSEISLRALYARDPFFNDDGRGPLFNRYFDIIIVQKTMPYLLVGGFTLILQAVVGFALVSLYHPLFLAFNAIVIGMLWLVWMLWGRRAIRAAVKLSHKKHLAAAWIEGLGDSNGFFKAPRHIDYALHRTDAVTGEYIDQHRTLFRYTFSQVLSLLFIYAAASAALLGLGGWLVTQGQLSLGQLVAAELVLSAVFFGISQMGGYLTYFYDLCAATEELSLFHGVEVDEPKGRSIQAHADNTLAFVNVRGDARGKMATINWTVESGATVMAAAESHGLQRMITNLLKRNAQPKDGYISLGGADILDTDTSIFTQEVVVLDRPTLIEMTIREYLRLSAEDVSSDRILESLKIVGLDSVLTQLDDGLDTKLAANGWPLSITETMLLKLAGAMISQPRIIVLNQLYDLVAEDCLIKALAYLKADKTNSVIYFTRRRRDLGCDTFAYLEYDRQTVCSNFDTFAATAFGSSSVEGNSDSPETELVDQPLAARGGG